MCWPNWFRRCATGHSARDIYAVLATQGVPLEPKPFAIGVRLDFPSAASTGRSGAAVFPCSAAPVSG